jgi:hypothetical protein
LHGGAGGGDQGRDREAAGAAGSEQAAGGLAVRYVCEIGCCEVEFLERSGRGPRGYQLPWILIVNGQQGTLETFAAHFGTTKTTIRDRIENRQCLSLSYRQLREMGRRGIKPPIVDKHMQSIFDLANKFLRLKAP